MKLKSWILAFTLALAAIARGATNDLTGLLQKGLFEEEANRNLDAAISEYQSLASAFDKDRQVAATAIFRLGECYRKLGRTNDAIVQYQRIVRDFPDQPTLVTLSRQNMDGLGQTSQPPLEQQNAPNAEHVRELEIVKRLKNMPLDQVRQVAPTLLTDATLINLIYQFNQSELNMTRLLIDHGRDHPEVKKEEAMQDALGEKIRNRLDGLITALSLELEISETGQKESVPGNNSVTGATDEEQKQIRNIQAMIQNSPDLINAPYAVENGYVTPLEEAAAKGQLVVAKYLLDHGADVNRSTDLGTPLYAAAKNGHKAMVELLLARGADVNAGNPLYQAASKDFIEVAEVLLANKADVNSPGVGADGARPLHAAVRTGKTELVQLLISHGANVNAVDDKGETPLEIAAMHNDIPTAKLLLAAKANLEARDKEGAVPLHEAASSGGVELISLLLDSGASVDATNYHNGTPLLYAVNARQVDATRILLAHKADPNHFGGIPWGAGRYNNSMPIYFAIIKPEILKLLLDAGANPEGNPQGGSPLISAIYQGKVDSVELLLQHGANPNGPVYGILPLAEAIKKPEAKPAIPLLLDKGADPNAPDSDGLTPLFHTTDPEIGRWLVEHKADADSRLADGETPLMRTTDTNYLNFLLDAGAHPDLQDTNGNTALHWGVYHSQLGAVAFLLEHKANPNIQNNAGFTPLDLAKSESNGRISGEMFVANFGPSGANTKAEKKIAELLTQAGGLANLPKRNRIEVRRGSQFITAITKDPQGRNRYSLLETIATVYGIISPDIPRNRFPNSGPIGYALPGPIGSGYANQLSSVGDLPFPDFKKVIIYRSIDNSAKQTAKPINLEDILNTGDCSRDIWLQWGDVVEVPESDHPVDEQWRGLPDNFRISLIKCIARQVTIKIKGESTTLDFSPEKSGPPPGTSVGFFGLSTPASFMLRSVLDNSKLIRVSSDLSRVKVTRIDPETKKTVEWTIDCTSPDKSDLWLRDGDVINVPEK